MDITTLVNLTSKAWSLRALALLHQGVPGRQAPLLAASGAGRTAFAASLHHLVDLGFLERNPGHGHPLRPEFRLTETGQALAPLADQIERMAQDDDGAALLRKAWSIPLLAVTEHPTQFSQIRRHLTPITDRALSAALRHMHGQNWIERSVDIEQHPPRPLYVAKNLGAEINRVIGLRV